MARIKVAIVGAGNCASSLVQGVEFYRKARGNAPIPGIMHWEIGGYHIGDIEFVAAFDVAAGKVGHDLAEAILAPPNNTARFAAVPPLGVEVRRGPTHDGIGRYLRGTVVEAPAAPDDVAATLRASGSEVLISYLPVGSEIASRWYAEQALAAGCAFVNCIPVFIAKDRGWRERFRKRGLPLVGDDVKSQVGATIVHRVLATLFRERGVAVDRTYQLNFGGNSDFQNMLERERLQSKKRSKTDSVISQLAAPLSDEEAHVSPSDYVPWLGDRKWCYIRLEGTSFGNLPLNCELKLEVWDSPNSAGVVIDAIRCAKLALDRGVGGALKGPSSYFMKSPPAQFTDYEARALTEAFIRGEDHSAEGRKVARARKANGKAADVPDHDATLGREVAAIEKSHD
ncbi:MAG TPA: inositol-3-phosphate synthase [Stellaceae bacterium]|nr:inositol-3-phosphate synthase [Stellaceae bacterium]